MTTKINLTRQQKKDVLRLVRGYELQNEKIELENNKDNLDNEIKLIQYEIQQLEVERDEIDRENASITQDNKKLQVAVKDLKRKLVKMKSQKSMLQIQKIQSYSANEDAKNKEEKLQEQKKILTSFIDVISTPKKKKSISIINEFGEEEDEEYELSSEETNEDSPAYQQIVKLNQEVSDRCNEISNLKSLLDNSTNLIKKLQVERNEILKSISSSKSSSSKADKNTKTQKKKTLNKNLDDLASQIISQNEAISRAIKEEPKQTEKKSNSKTTPKQKVVKREVPISPRQQIQQQQHEQSGLQVAYLINSLQQQVSSLTEENAKLQSQLVEAEDEREMIFMSLGISKYNTEEDDKKETGKLDKQSELITKEIQRMKDELSQRLEEVSFLKAHLEESTNTILQLRKEHDEILRLMEQSQEEESDNSSLTHTSLLENLDELVIKIENQNESINQEIDNHHKDDNSSVPSSPSHKKQRVPFKRPQNSISEVFKKLQNDLNEANLSNAQKDTRIEELEESEATLHNLVKQLTERIEQLTDEHQSIMQALYGCEEEESDRLKDSELIDNLNSLNTSISIQNETINSAIGDDQNSLKNLTAQLASLNSPTRRNRPQRPQNQVIEALKKIRADLKEVTESNFDKEQRIEELENQLKEARSVPLVTERSINIEEENSMKETIESQKVKLSELTKKANEFKAQCISSNEQIQFLSNEVQKLSLHLSEVKSSIKRARALLGQNDTNNEEEDDSKNLTDSRGQILVNFAEDLEAQLMTFITKSAAEQSNNFSDLERRISELNKENDQLKNECKALNFEKNSVLSVLHVLDESAATSSDNDNESSEFEFEIPMHSESPLFVEVQKMTQTVKDQLFQINELKKNLVQAAKTIQKLNNERSSFMQALLPEEMSASANLRVDSATKKLFKNLEALGLQISKQSDDMNSAIGEEVTKDVKSEKTQIQKSPRRERESFQRPQSFVISALEKIRSQLEKAQHEISEKEIKIAELENEIDSLHKE